MLDNKSAGAMLSSNAPAAALQPWMIVLVVTSHDIGVDTVMET